MLNQLHLINQSNTILKGCFFYCSKNSIKSTILFIKNFFLILFLAVLGLCCCPCLSLVAVSGGCSLVVMCRLLLEVAFLVVEHGL